MSGTVVVKMRYFVPHYDMPMRRLDTIVQMLPHHRFTCGVDAVPALEQPIGNGRTPGFAGVAVEV